MKNNYFVVAVALALTSTLLISCVKDSVKRKYTIVQPVFALKQEVYDNLQANAPQPIVSPGKMFLIGDYIYLNEIDKGVHVIDRSNPNNLVNVAFIPIPDNQDLAVKDNVLYADCSSDLLVIDVAQPANAQLLNYVLNVFPDKSYNHGYYVDENHVIVDWIIKDTVAEENYLRRRYGGMVFEDAVTANSFMSFGSDNSVPTQGISGSSARFSVVNDFLYTVTHSTLNAFNISAPTNPSLSNANPIGWNIETVYPFNNYLFIGSQSGMFIFNLDNPASPQQESMFSHVTQCDPVIADEHHAYVTLRNGTTCNGFINQLDVLNIDNVAAPQLVKTLPLTNPRGLSKDGNLLFMCDGASGLRIIDASNPASVSVSQTVSVNNPNDVITWNKIAYVSADDGLYLFDYSDYPTVTPLGNVHYNR